MNLSYFKSESLYDAGRKFFSQELSINLSASATTNLSSAKLLDEYLKGNDAYLLSEITEAYLLGRVDDGVFTNKATAAIHLDTEAIKDSDTYKGILVFAIRSKSKFLSRSEIAKLTRALNRRAKDKPVILLVLSGNHLTYATAERNKYKQEWREGEQVGKISMLKDIYIDAVHRGHQAILQYMQIKPLPIDTFEGIYEHWKKVFSVQLLNKNFYQDLFHWYLWAKRLIKIPPRPKDEEQDEDTLTSIFTIRLLTRLLFVWFVKEKKLIPLEIFRKEYVAQLLKTFNPASTEEGNYYKAVLQNLFFATLNTPMAKDAKEENEKRQYLVPKERKNAREYDDQYLDQTKFRYDSLINKPADLLHVLAEVPFLNGGLFECLDYREGNTEKRYDGFSTSVKKQALVPDILFFGKNDDFDLSDDLGDDKKMKHSKVRGIIDILDSYKFTITENTPLEEEIALDPELLGKVFENLLASYNPETKTTARKQTGSFYTPREIVSYMVDESLKSYLLQKLLAQPTGFVETGKVQGDFFGNASRKGQLKMESEIKKQPTEKEKKIQEEKLNTLFKYGIDDNPFTADETTLLIDAISNCRILDPACGSGAFPMGILHRMVHLLSKLDPNNKQWKKAQQKKAERDLEIAKTMGDEEIKAHAIESAEQRIKYIADSFNSPRHELDYTRKLFLIENCIYGVDIQQIAVQIAKLRFFISLMAEQKMDDSRPNRNILSMPNLETKFVAANTLIALEKPEKQMSLLDMNPEIKKTEDELRNLRSKIFFTRKYSEKKKLHKQEKECRAQLLKVLTDNDYKKSVAEQMSGWNPFDQLHHAKFFDSETMFELSPPQTNEGVFDIVIGNPPYGAKFTEQEKQYFKSTLKHQDYQPESFLFFTEKSFDFLRTGAILSFIIPNTWLTNLKLVKIRKFLTGSNVISNISHYHKGVFDAVVDTEVVIFKKGFIPDNIVNVFNHKESNQIFELTHNQNNWKEKNGDVINIFTNPMIESLIQSLKVNTSPLSDLLIVVAGFTPYRLGYGNPVQTKAIVEGKVYDAAKKLDKSYKAVLRGKDIEKYLVRWDGKRWIKYGDNLAEPRYTAKFDSKEKIVMRQTGDALVATLDDAQFVCMKNMHVMHTPKKGVELKFLLSLLNSTLLNFYFQYLNPETGEALAEVKKETVEKLLIKKAKNQKPFIAKVDKILLAKASGKDTTPLEKEIDLMVYKLYQLTYEEVKIVEPDFSMSKKEYDALEAIESEKIVPATPTVIPVKKKRKGKNNTANELELDV